MNQISIFQKTNKQTAPKGPCAGSGWGGRVETGHLLADCPGLCSGAPSLKGEERSPSTLKTPRPQDLQSAHLPRERGTNTSGCSPHLHT